MRVSTNYVNPKYCLRDSKQKAKAKSRSDQMLPNGMVHNMDMGWHETTRRETIKHAGVKGCSNARMKICFKCEKTEYDIYIYIYIYIYKYVQMLVYSEIQILFHNSVTQLAEVAVAATA